MKEFFQLAGQVAGIGGIALVVFLAISKSIVGKTRTVNQGQSFTLLNRLLILAAVITVLGMISWLISLAIGSDKEVRLRQLDVESRDKLVEEIRVTNETLSLALASERKQTSELMAQNTHLTELLNRFTETYSADTLPEGQSEIIDDANETLRLAAVEIEARLGGRGRVVDHLQDRYPSHQINPAQLCVVGTLSFKFLNEDTMQANGEQIAGLVKGIGADLLALQEVTDHKALSLLLDELGRDRFDAVISDEPNINKGGLAIIFDKNQVDLVGTKREIDTSGPRIALFQGVNARGIRFDFVNIHFKSRVGGPESTVRRRAEAEGLIELLTQENQDVPTLVAGVFQVDHDRPEFDSFRDVGFFFPTVELPDDATTFISEFYTDVLSHFAVSPELRPNYLDGTCEILSLPELFPKVPKDFFRKSLTDHNPLVAVFSKDRLTSNR